MSLSDAMSRLTNEFQDAYDSRIEAVGSIRTAAAQQSSDFRAAHEAMAVATRQYLDLYATTLRQEVGTLIHDHNAERQALHAEQRANLGRFRDELQHTVATITHDHHAKRQALHTEQRANLGRFRDELQHTVATITHDHHAKRQALHTEQRASLDRSMNQLKINGESFRAEATTDRNRLHADRVGAQQTWAQFSSAMQQQREGTTQPSAVAAPAPSEPKPAMAMPTQSEPKPAVLVPTHDDLTVIRGIGNGMQGRLNQIGILTYADLAGSSPEQLRIALAEVGRLVNVDDWIAEAHKLMARS